MPVIMCSSLTQRGARVTLEALACGASDYVAKPAGQSGREAAISALNLELSPKIHALTAHFPGTFPSQQPVPGMGQTGLQRASPSVGVGPHKAYGFPSKPTVLAIGVSTGGPAALDVLLPMLPREFPLPVMIVQHMPELFTKLFAERLDRSCKLRVREGSEGDQVSPGTVSIARGNWHMEVLAAARSGTPPTLHLSQGPLENHCRPAVDVLFRSVAAVYGAGTLAVVLTGMGSDGLARLPRSARPGGTVLAQDQASSVVWGMPGAVSNAGLAHKELPLFDIAAEILRLTGRTHIDARELREGVV